MSKNEINVSVVVTAHHEGRLAHHTMRSLFISVKDAKEKGLSTEIIVVMDRPDENTLDYFSKYDDSEITAVSVDFGDLGLSRNYGGNISSGKYIFFLDSDNLFGKEWLYKTFRYLEDSDKEIIVHPEYQILFESKDAVWHQLSTLDPNFFLEDLIEFNYWDAVCALKKETLSKYPYESTTQTPGFGYEDWYFNCQTIADGIEHHVVPETVHFRREKKSGSLLEFTKQSHRVIRPSKLFEYTHFSGLIQQERNSKNREIPSKSLRLTKTEILKNYSREYAVLSMRLLDSLSPKLYRFMARTRKRIKTKLSFKHGLPDWLITEWKAVHAFDPQIFPDEKIIGDLPVFSIPRSRLGRYYLELCKLYGEGVSHVFLVPWLKRGGSDLETLNYIEALDKYKLGNRAVVISTDDIDSPWAERLPAGTGFIEFGKICSDLSPDEKEKLLTRLLLQTAPHAVHNINSNLGYRIFVKYGKALQNISNLYLNLFCADFTEEGKMLGYSFQYFPDCFDYVTAVAFDNQAFIDNLCEIYAFDRKKLYVHYHPIKLTQTTYRKKKSPDKTTLDILWAGRIDRQKRPDLLTGIAGACKDLPLNFHVYGDSLLDVDVYTRELKKLKNVTYYGAFNGLHSLPAELYDLYLYTSQWDGLPNVLLEAISLGLPIIASNVGGVGELIIPDKTGYLIEPYDDVDVYVNCLKNILSDRTQLNYISNNAYELVKSRHSWDKFAEELRRFSGYVS
ncbi:MAG: glycosyltransferase [Nitrospirae bacterium]|nr:glycosyltransferase [Nitrospirota bacterium]